GADGYLS
ncbi:hypothetical protein PGANDO_0972, partial [Porphyromonas gingivalis]